jgi:hypothetical protein
MTLQRPNPIQHVARRRDLPRVLVILAAVIVLMLVATAMLGVQQLGPLYEIVPDPAHLSGLSF